MRYEDLPYRRNVGIMLVNQKGLIFVGQRRAEAGPEHVDAHHSWQMPQGGIDKGEDPYPAALRELAEETGQGHDPRSAWLHRRSSPIESRPFAGR